VRESATECLGFAKDGLRPWRKADDAEIWSHDEKPGRTMNLARHAWMRSYVVLYIILGLGWVGFAVWVAPPRLVAERPGRVIEAVRRYLEAPPVPFLVQDPLGRWREFSGAVSMALVLHLTVVEILRRYDRRAQGQGSSRECRAASRLSLALAIVAAAFLAITILSGTRQDYFIYLQIWYRVRQGDDPWFEVAGMNALAPLNAYGPLFNLLAPLAWINPLAPKLLFAYAYLLFAITQIKGFAVGRPPSLLRTIALNALFWNPFVWVELAFYGHFDILVGLACLGAVRAWDRGRDIRSGACLAGGVLLKYLPIVLLPFPAFDRGRPRSRFLVVALAMIALGLGLSCRVWGLSTLSPLKLAATRQSTTLSIFFFLRGQYSPLRWVGVWPNVDYLEPWVQCLALLRIWSWSRARKPGVEVSALVAVATVVLLYRVGYPQYQMVPLVLASAWALAHWERLRNRTPLVVAMACYFGWLAAFDVYYMLQEAWRAQPNGYFAEDLVGLPTFLLGCAFLAAAILATRPSGETTDPVGWSDRAGSHDERDRLR
jgi:hypothetical protein